MIKYLFYCFLILMSGVARGQDSASYWWSKTDSAYRIPDFELGQLYEQHYRKADKYPPRKIFALANYAVQRNYEKFTALLTSKKTDEALLFGNWLLSVLWTMDTSRYEVKYWVRINEQMLQLFYSRQQLDSVARYRTNIYNVVDGKRLPEDVDNDFRFIDGLFEHKYVRAKEWIFGDRERSENNCLVRQKYIVFDTAGQRKGQFELSLVKLPSYNNDVPFDYVLTRLNLEGLGYHNPQEGVLLAYTYKEPLDYIQINKDIRSVIRGEYREVIVSVNDSIYLKNKIREELTKMSRALVAKEYGNFIRFLHPITRGRYPELKDAVTYYQGLYNDNYRFSFTAAEAGEPGKLVQYNGELQTVIPWTVHFTSGTKRYREVRTMSAHSLDNGKTWYFFEPFTIAKGGERLRPGMAMVRGEPYISEELKIAPTKQTELY